MNNYPYQQGTAAQVPPYFNQWAYPPAQQTPSQGDFIDQATKILNFVEALQQRQSGRQQAPQQESAPTQYSAGNFQAQTTQAIGEQERRWQELATSTPAYSPSTQINYAPSLQGQVSNNLEAALQQQVQTLAQGFNAAIAERDQCYRVIDTLTPFMQVNALLNQEIEEMDKAIAALVPFVQVANIWANESLMHEQVLNNVLTLFNDPDFLAYHAWQVWGDRIQANGQPALEWIGDEYMRLLDIYEQRYMAANNGQHSQIWYRMQPKTVSPVMGSVDSQNYAPVPPQFQPQQVAPQMQQVQQLPPMPPVPGGNAGFGGPIEELKRRVEMLKSGTPDLGQSLQRMHAQQRQMMNADIYI